jgi:uncharacterized membrane protein YqjE
MGILLLLLNIAVIYRVKKAKKSVNFPATAMQVLRGRARIATIYSCPPH